MQKISIDPALWATVRRTAFDRQTTASKLVEVALTQYLAKEEKDRARLATKVGDDPDVKAELTRMATQTGHVIPEAAIPVIEAHLRGENAPQVTMVAPWDEDVSPKTNIGAVIVGMEPPDVDLKEVSVVEDSPFGPAKVVSTPEEAKAAVAALPQRRTFTPVPKPVSPKKTSRARR